MRAHPRGNGQELSGQSGWLDRANLTGASVDNRVVMRVPTQPIPPPIARPVTGAPQAPPNASGGPPSPEHLRELELARKRFRKIRRAVGVAMFNGWTIGLFAALSLVIGLFSLTSLLIGMALGVVAYNELNGAKMLRRLDTRAPGRLALGQLGLCGVLIAYALWSIYSLQTGPSPYEAALAAGGQATAIVGSIEQFEKMITFAVYGGLIVGSLLFQGGTAWYYFSRAKHIRAYATQTPAWIIELERTGGMS